MNRGFTLDELILAVAIIGSLALAIMAVVASLKDEALVPPIEERDYDWAENPL